MLTVFLPLTCTLYCPIALLLQYTSSKIKLGISRWPQQSVNQVEGHVQLHRLCTHEANLLGHTLFYVLRYYAKHYRPCHFFVELPRK